MSDPTPGKKPSERGLGRASNGVSRRKRGDEALISGPVPWDAMTGARRDAMEAAGVTREAYEKQLAEEIPVGEVWVPGRWSRVRTRLPQTTVYGERFEERKWSGNNGL